MGAPLLQLTLQLPPAFRQSTTQAPSQITLQLLIRSQVTWLPGPTRGAQLLTSRHEYVQPAPHVVSHELTLWQRTLHLSPHEAAQVELLEQSTAQSLPHVAEQVLTELHSGRQPSPH
jgi:hypothetical protein